MATSVISHTATDPSGTAVGAGHEVEAWLMPSAGFRADATGVARLETTTTDASGAFTLTLERNSNIVLPTGSWWLVIIKLPESLGGAQQWPISVGAANASLYASLIDPVASSGIVAYLTQAVADARYLQSGSFIPASGDAVRYVATGGSDTNNGLSWGSPFLTLAAALTSLPAAGGKIMIGAGTFSFGSTITIPSTTKASVIIEGVGFATKLNYTAVDGTHAFTTAGQHATVEQANIVIRDLWLCGPDNVASGSGIVLSNTNPVILSNVWISHFKGGSGLYIEDGSYFDLYSVFTWDNKWGVTVAKNSVGSTAINFYRLVSRENTVSGLRVLDAQNLAIFGGVLESNTSYGLQLAPSGGNVCHDVICHDVWMENNGTANVFFDVTNASIIAPQFINCRTATTTAMSHTGANGIDQMLLQNCIMEPLTIPSVCTDTVLINDRTTTLTDNGTRTIRLLNGEVRVTTGLKVGVVTAGAGSALDVNGRLMGLSGTGTPEGAVTAPVGSIFMRTDGGAGATLYIKETGAGNTGWAAK